MYYGLDFEDVRYETDHAGNKLKATIPYPMFSALIEFWREARRAQTASIEARTRPGSVRGSLGAVPSEPGPEEIALPPARPSRKQSHWDKLLEALPPEPAPPVTPPQPDISSPPETPQTSPKGPRAARGLHVAGSFFPREFDETIPAEVMTRIRAGTYFLRAWREYRQLTREDITELFGKTWDAVNWHENGYTRPAPKTLARFAAILDCTIPQLTAKAGSDTAPWRGEANEVPQKEPEPLAPENTAYPDGVLYSISEGKTPLTAWRLYRGWSLAELAGHYGCSISAMRQMEKSQWLRAKTITKLCPILKCRPEQLLRPADLPAEQPQPMRVAA
jgi:transcriptional regulator with XRE-family HTH domain